MVNFDATPEEIKLIQAIAKRAVQAARKAGTRYPLEDMAMDIAATHANGNPLDLERLLAADDFNFAHDVWGIRRHLDRETGKLRNCFLPRFSRRSSQPKAPEAPPFNLTAGEWLALESYANAHGRNWRARLRDTWMAGADANRPDLRTWRNKIGPSGLDKIRFPKGKG